MQSEADECRLLRKPLRFIWQEGRYALEPSKEISGDLEWEAKARSLGVDLDFRPLLGRVVSEEQSRMDVDDVLAAVPGIIVMCGSSADSVNGCPMPFKKELWSSIDWRPSDYQLADVLIEEDGVITVSVELQGEGDVVQVELDKPFSGPMGYERVGRVSDEVGIEVAGSLVLRWDSGTGVLRSMELDLGTQLLVTRTGSTDEIEVVRRATWCGKTAIHLRAAELAD